MISRMSIVLEVAGWASCVSVGVGLGVGSLMAWLSINGVVDP
jgi:hypothetical protein